MAESPEVGRVLIVDDEADLRQILVDVLTPLGIVAVQAESGEEALKILQHSNFHLVLCDVKMGGMNGIECLQKALAEGNTTPFVFMTGYSDTNMIKQAVRLGAMDFIEKPFDIAEVKEIVKRAIYIGIRRERILKTIGKSGPELLAEVTKNEKVVSQMRAFNHLKRAK